MTADTGTPPALVPDEGELIAFGLLMDKAQKALAAALERTEAAEAAERAARTELAALERRTGLVIAGAVEGEQARAAAADAKLDEIRSALENFLRNYEDADLLLFKVGRDLAGSLLKILDGTAGKPAPEGEVPGA